MSEILVDCVDHVTTITLSRPERLNAMTQEMFALMEAAWRAADDDSDCRAIVITGDGGDEVELAAAGERVSVTDAIYRRAKETA